MRDKIGNFSESKNLNPHVDSGIYSLREIGNANEIGSISKDPYLGNVEFILKFEQPNGSRDYVNSIPNDKWFYAGHSYADKSGSMSPGYISYSRSKFGNGSYFNNTCHPTDNPAIHGFFYTDIISLGYEDFTLECWVNFTTLSQNNSSIFWLNGQLSQGGAAGHTLSGGFNLYLNSSGVLLLYAAGQTLSSGTTPFVVNTWHHVALIRKNGILRVFVDGTSRMSSVANANILATTGAESGYCFAPGNLRLFGIRASNSFYGDEVRLTRNVARYWDNFTPSSQEFPAPTKIVNPNVIALMKFDESDVVNNHAGRSKDLVKMPPVVTNDKKFGVSSLQPNSYCSFHQLDPSGKIGTGDFNISCWIKPTAKNGGNGYPIFSLNKKLSLFVGGAQWATYNKSGLTGQDSPFDGRVTLTFDGKATNQRWQFGAPSLICQTPKNTISLNVWQHVLVSRKNNVYRIFVDGVLKATGGIPKRTTIATTSSLIPTGFAYGSNIYVTTTTNSNYSTSTDGVSWTSRSMPSNRNWQGLIYANNQFTTIGYDSNAIAHSTDGINWTTATLPTYSYNTKEGVRIRNAGWFRVAYGNNTYVAIGASVDYNIGQKVITSSDGTNWTTRSSPAGTFTDLRFLNGEFLISTSSGIFRSSNGTSWTATHGGSFAANTICYGNNVYLTIVPYSTGRYSATSELRISSNLSTFTTVNIPRVSNFRLGDYETFLNHYSIHFLNNKFYLFPNRRSIPNYSQVTNLGIATTYCYGYESEDGINWNHFSVPGSLPYPVYTDKIIGAGYHRVTSQGDYFYYDSGSTTSYITTFDGILNIDTSYLIIGGYGGNTSRGTYDEDYYTRISENSVPRIGQGSPNEFLMPTNHLTGNLNDRWGEFRFEGLIDEFIIDKNTGIDSNFTPPTSSISVRHSY
jgi:hypothetical protein